MANVYAGWDRMTEEARLAARASAAALLETLEPPDEDWVR